MSSSRLMRMRIKLGPLSLKDFRGIVSKRDAAKIYWFAFARIATNSLDIIGLIGIALLATAFGAFASGNGSSAGLELPIIGTFVISELTAVILALGVAAVFVVKSAFSIWLNLRTALFIATLEADFSSRLAADYFDSGKKQGKVSGESLSEFQNISINSTSALAIFVNARIAAISEISLLTAMVVVFMAVNPIATAAMFIYLSGVLWALSQVVTKRIRSNGKNQLFGGQLALSTSRDLFGIRREASASGTTSSWVSRFKEGRSASAGSTAVIYTLNSLPRYVIETSLILGIFGFLAGIVLFSDLPSQAVTIGVFMAGGLRLVASLLPLQAAINSMIDGANRGMPALDRLKQSASREPRLSESESSNQVAQKVGQGADPLNLVMKDVSFGFNTETQVLNKVSFSVEAGQKVAIVGPSGAGKTTCFEIATGFLEPDQGIATVGGVNPRKLLSIGNGAIGIVPQRPHLVSGTLSENVTLAIGQEADTAKVQSSLRLAGMGHFAGLQNLEMLIQPDAGQLSGGEIQRLGLARALYRDPGILFLDEATSALDAATEDEINSVLDGLKGRMTIVLIAHRLSTVKNADKIIYLDSGSVVAEGTFKELQVKVPGFKAAVSLMGLEA